MLVMQLCREPFKNVSDGSCLKDGSSPLWSCLDKPSTHRPSQNQTNSPNCGPSRSHISSYIFHKTPLQRSDSSASSLILLSQICWINIIPSLSLTLYSNSFSLLQKTRRDVGNFDKEFTKMPVDLTPTDKLFIMNLDQNEFQGFSYTNPEFVIQV